MDQGRVLWEFRQRTVVPGLLVRRHGNISKQGAPRRDLEEDSSQWELGSGPGDAGHRGKVTGSSTWLSPLLLATALST